MDSGRSTPVAMSRPSSGHAPTSSSAISSPLSSPRPPEQPPRPPLNRSAATYPPMHGPISSQSCLVQCILDMRASNIAMIHGSLLTAIGLGWAVYSRIFRFNLEAWMAKFGQSETSNTEDTVSEIRPTETPISAHQDRQPRLDTTSHVERRVVVTSASPAKNEPEHDGTNDNTDLKTFENEKQDREAKSQPLLQKHIAYLEPWVSKQPFPANEITEDSESRLEDELRRMSLPAFTDLSTAIYRDVRRREQESSPGSPNPPQTPGWDREHAPRMVLCRTINAQYLRLVLALVLELARRITETRIAIKRATVIVGN